MKKSNDKLKRENVIPNEAENNFRERIKTLYGDKLSFEKMKYVNNKTPIFLSCKIHGEFKVMPCNIVRSKAPGCPRCSGAKVNKDDFIRLSNIKHNGKYDYSQVVYKNTTTPVLITCPLHGNFKQAPHDHYKRGIECKQCAFIKRSSTTDDFILRSNKVHGDKYDYSQVVYKNLLEPVIIGCSRHGFFQQLTRSHLGGHGCIKCFREDSLLGKEVFIEKAKLVHGDKYDYSQVVYKGNKTPVIINCKIHGIFKQKPNSHVSQKSGCPKCIESKGETEIRSVLTKLDIPFIQEFKIKPYLFRYDFYLPEQKILIEYHGQQHYKSIELFGGDGALIETKRRDSDKQMLAKQEGLKLIVIPYNYHPADNLDLVIKRSLKRAYRYWLKVNGRIKVFKDFVEIIDDFNLPGDTTPLNVLERLKEKCNVVILF